MTPEGTDSSSDLTGQVLSGRYRIIAKLGEGAMGAVYLGEHVKIGRRDAIKVLRADSARDAEATARFMRGARNVSTIRHPNVCAIYDFSDTADGRQFLAMEYVEGETLKDILEREGRLELPRALDIAIQVADALQAAHDVGIVHRDLKPGNIMIERRPDGRDAVKVVDFDIAKGPADNDAAEVTRLGFVVGTPEYMSPEQLTGDRLDGRSDVYSLGVVIFRMLTGALPFNAASAQDIMVQRLTSEALRLNDVLPGSAFPQALSDLLQRSLARKANERPASARDFGRELRQSMSSPVPRVAEVPPTRVQRVANAKADESPAWLRPRVLVPAGVLLLAVALIAFVVTKNGSDAPSAPQQSQSTAPASTDAGGSAAPNNTAVQPVTGKQTSTTQQSSERAPAAPAAEALATILGRQLEVLQHSPSAATLQAVRDTALHGWNSATTRGDSATAALVLAQAALASSDNAECVRWARAGAALGRAGFETILSVCQ